MSGPRTLPERAFRQRARLVAVLFCAVAAGLAFRLFWLQLRASDRYTQRALGQQLRDTIVPADRGRIYSADGVLLAANSSCWTLRASPREMPEEKLSLAAQGLAEILELDDAKLLEKFSDRTSNDCLLRYRVERNTADRVRDFCEENGITGIRINQDSKRWYPEGEFLAAKLASPVYALWNLPGIPAEQEMPKVHEPVGGRVGYYIRSGGHDVTLRDWQAYCDFLSQNGIR